MSADHVLIDTNEMPVEEDARNPGKKTQMLLSRDLTGGGVVRLSYWPPGFTEGIRKLIAHGGHRHYHRTVNERHYVLAGDWTSLYWPDPRGPAVRTRLYRHHYLENPPMVLHGISRDAAPVVGTKFLVWTSGAGTDIYEPEAKTESIDVEFEGEAPANVNGSPILFNAETVSWVPHPRQPQFLVKELSATRDGIPGVTLVNIPPGSRARISESSPDGPVRRWLYVISGDLTLDIQSKNGTTPAAMKEGGFLAWMSRASVRSADREVSSGGCVALCIGHVLDDAAANAA